MNEVFIKDDFIKLGQALKLGGLVGSGVEAKDVIQAGEVFLNGNEELQRGKKCFPGDVISFDGEEIIIKGYDS